MSLRSGLNVRSTFRFNALNANAGHRGGPAKLDDQEQGFYRGLPLLEILLGLRQACDVVASIAQSRELAPTRQRDRIIGQGRAQAAASLDRAISYLPSGRVPPEKSANS